MTLFVTRAACIGLVPGKGLHCSATGGLDPSSVRGSRIPAPWWIQQSQLWIWCHQAWSLVFRIVRWWSWSMCINQRWIMLVVGVLSLGVGWVLGESLCLVVKLTMIIPLGAYSLEACVSRCTPSLSTWILREESWSMLDGQRRRGYVVFLPEGIVFIVLHTVPTGFALTSKFLSK
jgi:hypothetical protein